MTAATKLRIGIIGLQPGRSWAAVAHVPALRALPDLFEIAGVANTTAASASAAAEACKLPRAFANVAEMVASPDVDLVAVTVKVPHHLAIVNAALDAGKHVYCEWPLGLDLEEARAMAERARSSGVRGFIGTQALYAPGVQHVRELLAEGYVGEVFSTTLVGTGNNWGPTVLEANAYTLDERNGATLLTIPMGHTMAALTNMLGSVAEVAALTSQRRKHVRVTDTSRDMEMAAKDQVLVTGVLKSGAPLSVHYRGGAAHGAGLCWDINGSEGDLRISAPTGHAQFAPLTVHGGRGDATGMQPIPLPSHLAADAADGPLVGNLRRAYAAVAGDLKNGTRHAPDFDDAVALHRVLAAVEQAAATGSRIRPSDL